MFRKSLRDVRRIINARDWSEVRESDMWRASYKDLRDRVNGHFGAALETEESDYLIDHPKDDTEATQLASVFCSVIDDQFGEGLD